MKKLKNKRVVRQSSMPIRMAEFKKKNRENQMQTKLQRRKNQFCLFMEMRIGQSFEDIIVD